MKVTVCIGSVCHLRGSQQVKEIFCSLIEKHNLGDKVEMQADFCTEKCKEGVSVTVDDELFSVSPETAEEFFETKILGVLK